METLPNASDVISQLPFVRGQDGDFKVFGNGTPIVFINGRQVQDLSELDRLMPSDIKNIKVNVTPGSKYSGRWYLDEYASLNYRYKSWDVFGSAYWTQRRQQISIEGQQLNVEDAVHEVAYHETESMGAVRLGQSSFGRLGDRGVVEI